MSQDVETVVVQREVSEDNPTGRVIINKADFDEANDKMAVDEAPAASTDPAAAATTETTTAPEAGTDSVVKQPWAK